MDSFYFRHHLQPFSHPFIAEDEIIKGKCYVASGEGQGPNNCMVLVPIHIVSVPGQHAEPGELVTQEELGDPFTKMRESGNFFFLLEQ